MTTSTGTVVGMGMDLEPRSGINGHHFNWSGWREIGDLLADLGCDLSEMSGSNDGEEVSADTARAWGQALRSALLNDELVSVLVEDGSYHRGWRSHIRTRAGEAAQPVLAVHLESSIENIARRLFLEQAHTLTEGYGEVAAIAAELPQAARRVEELDEDSRDWVERAATFFLESGGFAQY